MAGRDMIMQVVLRLRDDMGGKLNASLGRIRAWGGRAMTVFAGVGRALSAIFDRLALLGSVATLGIMAGLRSLAKFDASARDTAITKGLAGSAAENWIKKTERWASLTSKVVGQRSQDLLASQNMLIAAGLPEGPSTLMVPQIARVATAANASLEDMTTTSKVLFQSWGIGADRMELALGRLFEAGRLGNFELKSMAQFLPEIAPLAASIGTKGEGAIGRVGALLQISQMGAGDPSTAANNFKNFLSQATGPAFNKRMGELGVNMPMVLQDAAVKGIDPIEATLAKILKVTGAGGAAEKALSDAKARGLTGGALDQLVLDRVTQSIEGSKLGELFPDMQAKTFLATFMLHRSEYAAMRDQINSAGLGGVNDAFDTRMAGMEKQQESAGEKLEQITRRLSEPLEWLYSGLNKGTEKILDGINYLDSMNRAIVSVTASLGALGATLLAGRVAVSMAGFGGGALFGGLLSGTANFAKGLMKNPLMKVGFPLMAGATTGAALDSLDPAGNIWGFTSKIDAWTSKNFGFDFSKRGDEEGSFQKWLAKNSTAGNGPTATMPDPFGGTNPYADPFKASLYGQDKPTKTDVGGQIIIKVEGPGQVTSVKSNNPSVPIVTDRGANGGRP